MAFRFFLFALVSFISLQGEAQTLFLKTESGKTERKLKKGSSVRIKLYEDFSLSIPQSKIDSLISVDFDPQSDFKSEYINFRRKKDSVFQTSYFSAVISKIGEEKLFFEDIVSYKKMPADIRLDEDYYLYFNEVFLNKNSEPPSVNIEAIRLINTEKDLVHMAANASSAVGIMVMILAPIVAYDVKENYFNIPIFCIGELAGLGIYFGGKQWQVHVRRNKGYYSTYPPDRTEISKKYKVVELEVQ